MNLVNILGSVDVDVFLFKGHGANEDTPGTKITFISLVVVTSLVSPVNLVNVQMRELLIRSLHMSVLQCPLVHII